MTSILLGTLLSMSTASADITVRVHLPVWNRHHRHQSHCNHRPRPNPNGEWVFVPGHWENRGPHRRVWIHGHWKIARQPAVNQSRSEWIPGHWERRGRKRVWVPGHWS